MYIYVSKFLTAKSLNKTMHTFEINKTMNKPNREERLPI